jgi:hypothetical protein
MQGMEEMGKAEGLTLGTWVGDVSICDTKYRRKAA